MRVRRRCLSQLLLLLFLGFIALQYHLLQHFRAETSSPSLHDTTGSGDKVCPLCRNFAQPGNSTTTSVWNAHLKKLAESLLHPRDTEKVHQDWTRELLNLFEPEQLSQAIKASAHPFFIHNIATKIYQKLTLGNEAPPIKIIVVGGSVTEGTGCERSPVQGGKLAFESSQECAWPYRLQHLLDFFLPEGLFEVHNLATGGTHSGAAAPVLQYWLSPAFVPRGADIVINAYSANDNLPPAFHATDNTTIDNFYPYWILERNREFLEGAQLSSCGKEPPLILYANDYVGNQQESVFGESSTHEMVQLLADHEPNLAYISAAHLLQPFVYADTSETFFSGKWVNRQGKPKVDVHFGMAGHVATVLAVAFGMLNTAVDFCESQCHHTDTYAPDDIPRSQMNRLQFGLPSKEWVISHQPATIVANVTQSTIHDTNSCRVRDGILHRDAKCGSSPCQFAFLAAPMGTHKTAKALSQFLDQYTLQNDGWYPVNDFRNGGFQNKLGLVATQRNARMVLGFDSIATPIRVITFHYLKSYTDLWKESRAIFRIEVSSSADVVLHEEIFELGGFHQQEVSISYVSRLHMQAEAPVGSNVRLHLKMAKGETFKILGLMLCSR